MNAMKNFVTTGVIAEEFGFSRATISRWVREGYIKPTWITPAGQPRWTIEDFTAQLEQTKEAWAKKRNVT